jgi:hypothetical protein
VGYVPPPTIAQPGTAGGGGATSPIEIDPSEAFTFERSDDGTDLFEMRAGATADDDAVGVFGVVIGRSERPTVAVSTTAGEAITAANQMRQVLTDFGLVNPP